MTLSLLARSLHVLAALVWIGGCSSSLWSWSPFARRLEPAERARLVHATALRFRAVGWIAPGLLLLSGLLHLWRRPYLLWLLFHAKLGLVALALALTVVHDFVLGPRASGPGADPRLRARASWVARANVLVVLAAVVLVLALRG